MLGNGETFYRFSSRNFFKRFLKSFLHENILETLLASSSGTFVPLTNNLLYAGETVYC